jgi:hypothetical protein
LNQAALMAIVDGFSYWLLKNPHSTGTPRSEMERYTELSAQRK